MADRMTTREAIALCREQAAKESGPIREALEVCAAVAEHYAEIVECNADARAMSAQPTTRGDLCHED